jgi:hypothetical protein
MGTRQVLYHVVAFPYSERHLTWHLVAVVCISCMHCTNGQLQNNLPQQYLVCQVRTCSVAAFETKEGFDFAHTQLIVAVGAAVAAVAGTIGVDLFVAVGIIFVVVLGQTQLECMFALHVAVGTLLVLAPVALVVLAAMLLVVDAAVATLLVVVVVALWLCAVDSIAVVLAAMLLFVMVALVARFQVVLVLAALAAVALLDCNVAAVATLLVAAL